MEEETELEKYKIKIDDAVFIVDPYVIMRGRR